VLRRAWRGTPYPPYKPLALSRSCTPRSGSRANGFLRCSQSDCTSRCGTTGVNNTSSMGEHRDLPKATACELLGVAARHYMGRNLADAPKVRHPHERNHGQRQSVNTQYWRRGIFPAIAPFRSQYSIRAEHIRQDRAGRPFPPTEGLYGKRLPTKRPVSTCVHIHLVCS
jgi:hypothetical protein